MLEDGRREIAVVDDGAVRGVVTVDQVAALLARDHT
jgi:hypothetical protein